MEVTVVDALNSSLLNHRRPFRILGIAGSLRRDSYNRASLLAAQELLPADVELDIFDLIGIPVFNQDDEGVLPLAVREFKRRTRGADALLFAAPEYNASVPGVLKNAIDWASRPAPENAWARKPAAIMGASLGAWGTVRAQSHLRQILVHLDVLCLNQPEVMIADAANRFDRTGELIHEPTRKFIRSLLEELVAWSIRFDPETVN